MSRGRGDPATGGGAGRNRKGQNNRVQGAQGAQASWWGEVGRIRRRDKVTAESRMLEVSEETKMYKVSL